VQMSGPCGFFRECLSGSIVLGFYTLLVSVLCLTVLTASVPYFVPFFDDPALAARGKHPAQSGMGWTRIPSPGSGSVLSIKSLLGPRSAVAVNHRDP